MAKRKKVATTAATKVANSDAGAATQVANSSPATATNKAEKKPTKKAEPKPKLETRKVCFTDDKTGKKFCGEMTEVPSKETPAKVGRTRRRSN